MLNHIRQGDVLLTPVQSLPAGCVEVPNDRNRIVLAYGEVTGHAHAIADHRVTARVVTDGGKAFVSVDGDAAQGPMSAARAREVTDAAIARAKARLWQAPSGERFLEVTHQVNLTHEEHTAHSIPPGIYKLPVQVEYTPSELRRVED